MRRQHVRMVVLGALLLLPIAGLALLLAVPALDVLWEQHQSHFWLVLGVAVANVVLGVLTSEAAAQRGDSRLFMVSLALLASAGFLALHALATPGVVVEEPNAGFQIATPIGLILAAVFAAASALQRESEGREPSMRVQRGLRMGLGVLLAAWAVASFAKVDVLNHAPGEEAPPVIRLLAAVAVALYAFAAVRYLDLFRERKRTLTLAVAAAFVLLAEAMVAVVFGRSWHATWWEWHVLMAVAFGSILLAARSEYRRERSVTATFGGLYLERTLERVDRRQSEVLGELVAAMREDAPLAPLLERLRRQGFGSDEVAMLERSARELARMETLFRRYVGPRLADRLSEEPALATLGGREKDVSVLFADLQGFTSFSEGRPAEDVIEMVNAYWEGAVPIVVEREGGLIERFAGTPSWRCSTRSTTSPTIRCAPLGRPGDARPDGGDRRAPSGMATLPHRRQHRPRRHRQRGRWRPAELRRDRGHDERRRPAAVLCAPGTGARQLQHDREACGRGGRPVRRHALAEGQGRRRGGLRARGDACVRRRMGRVGR